MVTTSKRPPSTLWTSYDDWDWNGLKERLEKFMGSISKSSLTKHVELFTGKRAVLSEPFSAGQFWCCFEFILSDESLVIARVRLPRHPNSNENTTKESELYSMECEVATMRFLQQDIPGVPTPRLYAYEPPGSPKAAEVGACYMLIEGFYGNTLQDKSFSIYDLPPSTQEHIITQWTAVQAELASFTFPTIGSIASFSKTTGSNIGKLSAAVAERFQNAGPFASAHEYFAAVGEARYLEAWDDVKGEGEEQDILARLGPFIFRDIVQNTDIFRGREDEAQFHLNHMDMGTQNILVDDNYNFLAIIDWEFAQAAPLEVNHYPMPFPLIDADSETEEILRNPDHVAHENVVRIVQSQKLYKEKFREAEQALARQGRPLKGSIAETLNTPASRIYGAFEKIASFDNMREELVLEMIRLAFNLEGDDAKAYMERMKTEMENLQN